MAFPLEPGVVSEFARDLESIVVVEEKRSFVELQLRELLYNSQHRPSVYGKRDAEGKTLLPAPGELDAEDDRAGAQPVPPGGGRSARASAAAGLASGRLAPGSGRPHAELLFRLSAQPVDLAA